MPDDAPNPNPDPTAAAAAAGSAAAAGAPAAPPAVDPEVLKGALQGALKDVMPGLLEASKPAPVVQPRVEPRAPEKPDPVIEFLAPYIAPALSEVGLKAEAAMDAASFYATAGPQALKHRDAIEARFQEGMRAGKPFPRVDIFKWMKGDKFDEFVNEELEARKRSEDAARGAEHAGGAGRPHGGRPAGKDPIDMSDDELGAALKNAAF
jgi:hypothetical protein